MKQYNPKMHTAEHVLNQTMDRMFGCGRCFNAHIEKKKSKCDYHFNRSLTDIELKIIEDRVNEVIAAGYPVTEEFVSMKHARENYNLSKMPENVKESVRIVKIGDYDACPCIGKHVDSTKDIGQFKITSAGFENRVLRIRFKLI